MKLLQSLFTICKLPIRAKEIVVFHPVLTVYIVHDQRMAARKYIFCAPEGQTDPHVRAPIALRAAAAREKAPAGTASPRALRPRHILQAPPARRLCRSAGLHKQHRPSRDRTRRHTARARAHRKSIPLQISQLYAGGAYENCEDEARPSFPARGKMHRSPRF